MINKDIVIYVHNIQITQLCHKCILHLAYEKTNFLEFEVTHKRDIRWIKYE